jgi:hypothetical protein
LGLYEFLKILVDFGGENLALDPAKRFEFELLLEDDFLRAFLRIPWDLILLFLLKLDLAFDEAFLFPLPLLLALLLLALSFLFSGLFDFFDKVSLAFG